jgi:Protein of unknown function (DUF992)
MRYSLCLIMGGVLLASASIAEEARTTIGVLTCTLAGGMTDGARKMTCGFKPTGTATEEKYDGSLQGFGKSSVGKQVLVWSIVGPANTKLSAGFLGQRYARAKEIVGQPPSWIGETNSAIVLQFETHGDAGLAKGITQIDLKLAGTSA